MLLRVRRTYIWSNGGLSQSPTHVKRLSAQHLLQADHALSSPSLSLSAHTCSPTSHRLKELIPVWYRPEVLVDDCLASHAQYRTRLNAHDRMSQLLPSSPRSRPPASGMGCRVRLSAVTERDALDSQWCRRLAKDLSSTSRVARCE